MTKLIRPAVATVLAGAAMAATAILAHADGALDALTVQALWALVF